MEIKKSEFTISAPRVSMCPKDNKLEYAFIGRSNVGITSSSIMSGIWLTCLAMDLPSARRRCRSSWSR